MDPVNSSFPGKTIATWLRLGLGMACAIGLSGCGLFQTDLKAPKASEAATAKARDSEQWAQLSEAVQIFQKYGLPQVEGFLSDLKGTVRNAVLLQDLRALVWTQERLYGHYNERYLLQRDALSTYLLARVTQSLSAKRVLLEEARQKDRKLLQVRVDFLALEPFRVGDDQVLQRLLALLKQDPGLAEGWRLLREIAPRYGRPELARAAADLEPWAANEDPAAAHFDQVRTRLAAGSYQTALDRLDQLALDGREADFLRATALTELGRQKEAWVLLQSMLEFWPEDPMVHFNLALLARDHFNQPSVAQAELLLYLEFSDRAAARGEKVWYFRRLQAQTWLREDA
jgi:hypothetical protein